MGFEIRTVPLFDGNNKMGYVSVLFDAAKMQWYQEDREVEAGSIIAQASISNNEPLTINGVEVGGSCFLCLCHKGDPTRVEHWCFHENWCRRNDNRDHITVSQQVKLFAALREAVANVFVNGCFYQNDIVVSVLREREKNLKSTAEEAHEAAEAASEAAERATQRFWEAGSYSGINILEKFVEDYTTKAPYWPLPRPK